MAITVRFFIYHSLSDRLEEVIIDTEKTTIEEAYHVAVANGADPRKLIEYTYNKVITLQ